MDQLSALLGVTVTDRVPLTRDTGRWTEDQPWLTRLTLAGPPWTAIAKTAREEDPSLLMNETAALRFLDGGLAPRLYAATDGVVIMEDLGTGPSLDTVLLGADPATATEALLAYATALGRLHASTTGREEEYYALHPRPRRMYERISLVRHSLAESWRTLTALTEARGHLPDVPGAARAQWHDLLAELAEPRPWLALSNGDACPQNTRIVDGEIRFLDFDGAAFRHPGLDLAGLLMPFPACTCWGELPADLVPRLLAAHRAEFAPEGDTLRAAALGSIAWAVLRAIRIPKLEAMDAPHPMGFSRRGQLVSALRAAAVAGGEWWPELAGWLGEVAEGLEGRWGALGRWMYPAFEQND
ncbi:hypothetical protein Afil01_05850 [Actinorhabdospora filicis]|uniref:Aminoglycoside phosphotransferase domain-containing protein n=1 Tax=Actinorhabdospora filicis TaxID=1785913 RepID=A0A9W6SGW8_9ACTN|nr:hypothetical protein [Actinorhabdospora filicis]GLZ75778.1 hypothetical protein Afil01_05850 [Actinorhabdospora filicis]